MPHSRKRQDTLVVEWIRLQAVRKLRETIKGLREGGPTSAHRTVHQTRKSLKFVRAGLRLLRDHLGEDKYRTLNLTLRDAGRILAPFREAYVVRQTFQSLNLQDKLKPLLGRFQPPDPPEASFDEVRKILRKVQSRMVSVSLGHREWRVTEKCFVRVYRRGLSAMQEAEYDLHPTRLHEWRKQVKYLRHCFETLTPLWPGILKSYADELHRLSDELGQDHDLWVLQLKLKRYEDHPEYGPAMKLLFYQTQERRVQAQAQAFSLGKKLYAEDCKEFRARIRLYFRTANREELGQGEALRA